MSQKKHKAYQLIDDLFESFYQNNRHLLDAMEEGQIFDTDQWTAHHTNQIAVKQIFLDPWRIRYIGKICEYEGHSFLFFNRVMEEIYRYNNAE